MAIEDRNLCAGTTLTGKYKGQTYAAEVVEEDEGKLWYRLEDGRTFKSPSSAGKAVMDGKACNGWAFWSIYTEDEQVPPEEGTGATVVSIPKPQRGRKGKRAEQVGSAEETEATELA